MNKGSNQIGADLPLGLSIYKFDPSKVPDLHRLSTLRAQVIRGLRLPAKKAVDQAFKDDPVLKKIVKHVKDREWFAEGELTSTIKTFILAYLEETEREEKDFLGNVDHVRERLIKDYEDVYGCSSSKSEMKSPAAAGTKSPGKEATEELDVDCRKCGGKKDKTARKCKEPCFGGRMPDSSEIQPKEAKKMKTLASKEESKNKEEKKSKKNSDVASDQKEVVEKKRKKPDNVDQDENDQDDPFKKDLAEMEDKMRKKLKRAMNETIDVVMTDFKEQLREQKKRADDAEKVAKQKMRLLDRVTMRNDALKREKENLEAENANMATELAKYQEDERKRAEMTKERVKDMRESEKKNRVYVQGAPTSSEEEEDDGENDSGNESGDESEHEKRAEGKKRASLSVFVRKKKSAEVVKKNAKSTAASKDVKDTAKMSDKSMKAQSNQRQKDLEDEEDSVEEQESEEEALSEEEEESEKEEVSEEEEGSEEEEESEQEEEADEDEDEDE